HVLDQLEAGAAGHDVVGEDEVVSLLLEEPKPLGPACCQIGLAAPDREKLREETTDVALVIHDQNARRREHGKSTIESPPRSDQRRTSPLEMRQSSPRARERRVSTGRRSRRALWRAAFLCSQGGPSLVARHTVRFSFCEFLGISGQP